MPEFILQNLSSLLTGAVILTIVLLVTVRLVRRKKHSPSPCAGCPYAARCRAAGPVKAAPVRADGQAAPVPDPPAGQEQ